MRKPFFGLAIAAGMTATFAFGTSADEVKSPASNPVLGPEMSSSEVEMEAMEEKRWRVKIRLNNKKHQKRGTGDFTETVTDNGSSTTVNIQETRTSSSVSVSSTCVGSCSSSTSVIVRH